MPNTNDVHSSPAPSGETTNSQPVINSSQTDSSEPSDAGMPGSKGESKGDSKGETFSRPLDVPEFVRAVMRYARASKEDDCRAAVWLCDELARLSRERDGWQLIADGRDTLLACYRTGNRRRADDALEKIDRGIAMLFPPTGEQTNG